MTPLGDMSLLDLLLMEARSLSMTDTDPHMIYDHEVIVWTHDRPFTSCVNG